MLIWDYDVDCPIFLAQFRRYASLDLNRPNSSNRSFSPKVIDEHMFVQLICQRRSLGTLPVAE